MSPIVIGNLVNGGQEEFSPRFQAVLEFIDGGREWLDWARSQPGVMFSADQELELLEQIQNGLHDSPLITLAPIGLTLHPERLWAMEPQDLASLTTAVQSGSTSAMAFLLPKYGLLDEASLAPVGGYLQELGVAQAPVLANLDLGERIDLYQLRAKLAADAGESNQEAAAFAAPRAQTAREFIAYLYAYRAIASAKRAASSVAGRSNQASQQIAMATPLCYPYLSTANVLDAGTLDGLLSTLRSWLAAGNHLGYPTVPQALADLLTYANGGSGPLTESQVAAHLDAARQTILDAAPATPVSSQDGSRLTLTFKGEAGSAAIDVDAQGNAVLTGFTPAGAAGQ